MKKKKIKIQQQIKPSTIKYVNEDTNEIKKFIYILFGVAIIALLLYFLTAKYLVKDNFQNDKAEISEESISYDSINVGNIFNRPYESYYVLAFSSDSTDAVYYNNLLNKSDKKIYYVDLSSEMNKTYVNSTGNKKATKVSEISLVDPTLILIKDGKISQYYEGLDKINTILK